jgi:hypothetical protein
MSSSEEEENLLADILKSSAHFLRRGNTTFKFAPEFVLFFFYCFCHWEVKEEVRNTAIRRPKNASFARSTCCCSRGRRR